MADSDHIYNDTSIPSDFELRWEPFGTPEQITEEFFNYENVIHITVPVLGDAGAMPDWWRENDKVIRRLQYKLTVMRNQIHDQAQIRTNRVALGLFVYAREYSPVWTGWLRSHHSLMQGEGSTLTAMATSYMYIQDDPHPMTGNSPAYYGAVVHQRNPWLEHALSHAAEIVNTVYEDFFTSISAN